MRRVRWVGSSPGTPPNEEADCSMEEQSVQFIDTETILNESTCHVRWTSPSHSAPSSAGADRSTEELSVHRSFNTPPGAGTSCSIGTPPPSTQDFSPTTDHPTNKPQGSDSDHYTEAPPHGRGPPSPSLSTSPPPPANDTPRSQEQSSSHPYINTQWLQRRLSDYYFSGGFYREAEISRGKARKVLAILQKATANKECMNQLLRLLTRDCLDTAVWGPD